MNTTLGEFMVNVQKAKANWFDLYEPYTNRFNDRDRPYDKNQRGQNRPVFSEADKHKSDSDFGLEERPILSKEARKGIRTFQSEADKHKVKV